jgi:hypothetical protein
MKYLRILFLFGLVLFCGSVASHAQGAGFHSTILDPSCNTADTQCILHPTDIGVPFSVSLDTATCADADVTGLPSPPTPYGCFFGSNLTGGPITSFTLDFAAITGVTSCDTNIPESVSPAPAFSVTNCAPIDGGLGGYALTFSGGSIAPGNGFVILEEGVAPADFVGTAVADTPEPDSLLLLSTGTMMMGLYMAGRTRLFAFLKK